MTLIMLESARKCRVSNLDWRNRSITSDGPIAVEYADRELKISRAAIRLDDSTVGLSGNLPLDAGLHGELKIEGRTSLAVLTDLIPSETPVKARVNSFSMEVCAAI